jgi:hypothetical protein
MALVFTNGLKCRNKCEVASIPFFYFPTSLLIMKQPNNHKGNKSFLPSKDCIVCGKPFTWRKKWEKCWDEVKYCSDRCRKAKP